MKDKEMIEEMAKFIRNANAMNCFGENCDNCKYSWHEHCNSIMQATSVFNAGYRKIEKDDIVIDKQEYEDLQIGKDFDYGYHEGYKNTEAYYENYKLPKERKETASSIIEKLEQIQICKQGIALNDLIISLKKEYFKE